MTKQQHLSSSSVPGNIVFHMDLIARYPPIPLPAATDSLKREVVFIATIGMVVVTPCFIISLH